jgi:hypothetical protein
VCSLQPLPGNSPHYHVPVPQLLFPSSPPTYASSYSCSPARHIINFYCHVCCGQTSSVPAFLLSREPIILKYLGASMSHGPIRLHGLLQGLFYFFFFFTERISAVWSVI